MVLTAVAIVVLKPDMDGATAGFILGFARSITKYINKSLNMLRVLELKGVSIERTAEYQTLEQEANDLLGEVEALNQQDVHSNLTSVPPGWPRTGTLSVKNLSASHGPGRPNTLHEVTFDTSPGEQVGIVGATGSGKSTLAKTMFSVVEITAGRIELDGVDLSQVPNNTRRSAFGIVAQNPLLLKGTVRLNLDLEGTYADSQLYQALHQVGLLKPQDSIYLQGSEVGITEQTLSNHIQGIEQSNMFPNLGFQIETGGHK